MLLKVVYFESMAGVITFHDVGVILVKNDEVDIFLRIE